MKNILLFGDQFNILIWQVFKCIKKSECHSVLKLRLPLNQQYINIDLRNLQEPKIGDEVTEEQKLVVYEFRIDIKMEDVINAEKFFVVLYITGYCCCAV